MSQMMNGFYQAVVSSAHFYTGQQMHASPMTYSADETQYLSIAAGSDVFTFALP